MEKRKCLNVKVINNNNGFVVAKWCNSCYEYLNVESFSWDESKKGYLLGWCDDCNKQNVGSGGSLKK